MVNGLIYILILILIGMYWENVYLDICKNYLFNVLLCNVVICVDCLVYINS